MAKLYRLWFLNPEDEYVPKRRTAKKITKSGPNLSINLASDDSFTVFEEEIKKYWDYGGGIRKLEFAGEISDDYLKPVLSEVDFVEEQIRNKKNGDIVGYQG